MSSLDVVSLYQVVSCVSLVEGGISDTSRVCLAWRGHFQAAVSCLIIKVLLLLRGDSGEGIVVACISSLYLQQFCIIFDFIGHSSMLLYMFFSGLVLLCLPFCSTYSSTRIDYFITLAW